jgi:hypothetical protein
MITPIQAATVVNYLYAAQTISVVDDQDVVWADYLNAEIPEVLASDLLPACRQAIRDWAASGRSWRIDVGRYADAVRKLRRQRVVDATKRGALTPDGVDDPQEWHRWLQEATRRLMDGATREQAETAAYEHIGMTPPPPAITEYHTVSIDQIGAAS